MPLTEEKNLEYAGVKGIPHLREAGSAVRHRTGDWRVFKPKINHAKCISCKICFAFCPDSAIHWITAGRRQSRLQSAAGARELPVIDYHLCKGCLICKQECPVKAITADLDSHEDENGAKEKSE